jgi:hypothetical protein
MYNDTKENQKNVINEQPYEQQTSFDLYIF